MGILEVSLGRGEDADEVRFLLGPPHRPRPGSSSATATMTTCFNDLEQLHVRRKPVTDYLGNTVRSGFPDALRDRAYSSIAR